MNDTSWRDRLFFACQWLLPSLLLSSVMHRIAESRTGWIKRGLIAGIMRHFRISLDDAQISDPRSFSSFNDFFTRALRSDARPLAAEPAILSPVDGSFSQLGKIHDGRIFQAKGHGYTSLELLGGQQDLAAHFAEGEFATIYLAPNNYHHIHLPIAGTLREWVYVPGRLFSVNPATVRACPRLFARNERLCMIYDTAVGPMAVVLVGALFVGSIETLATGRLTPPHGGRLRRETVADGSNVERGSEIGRFNMGSTVILLAGPGTLRWEGRLAAGSEIRMGEAIAQPLHR